MHTSLIRKFVAGFVILIAFLCSTTPVLAARTFFGADALKLQAGQLFKVDVYVDTQGASVNAIEGRIVFPRDIAEPQRVSDADSIVSFWIERPKLSTAGQIAFSGVIPGGVVGGHGRLFSATFLAKKQGRGFIEFRGVRALRNDGVGTALPMTFSRLSFLIAAPTVAVEGQVAQIENAVATAPALSTDVETGTVVSPLEVPIPDTKDDSPPEAFTPQLASDDAIFDGQWFVAFATQDKGSGIDRYEVCEGKKACVIAASPYLLRNQALDANIVIKAFDKNGNVREFTFPARNGHLFTFAYAIVLALAVLGIAFGMWKVLRGKGRRVVR